MEGQAEKQNHPGKCARCGRGLRRVYVIDGAAYGPVCVRKMGYTVASDGNVVKPQKAPVPSNQPGIFDEPLVSGKLYVGFITKDAYQNNDFNVSVNGQPLNPRLDLINHSPTGLAWGYGGSGPAQCALAILSDYLQDDQLALAKYQDFKSKVVADFPMDSGWILTGDEIAEYLAGAN